MVTDQVSDMLTRIRNSLAVGKETVPVSYSRFCELIAGILVREGFLGGMSREGYFLNITLLYDKSGAPVISSLRRISKPGLRVYGGGKKLPVVRGRKGVVIVSTPEGLMTTKEAKKKGLGGEIICEVW